MSKSKIEWTDRVWNPVTGCTKASEGCRNCYAERMSKRLAGRCGYPADEPFRVTLHPDKLGEPLRWKKPSRLFVCSMGDLFHEDVPFDFIEEVFTAMQVAQWHTYIVLTKRPEKMAKFMERYLKRDKEICDFLGVEQEIVTKHIWLGVSVENQAAADERIPLLLQTPAAVRFISAEPLLGTVNLDEYIGLYDCMRCGYRGSYAEVEAESEEMICPECEAPDGEFGLAENNPYMESLDWVIVGGESGPGARPMHPDWVRSLRDQCQAAGVPFMFKQWGEWFVPEDGTRACRVCGCTQHNACEGGCWWIEDDLCSKCEGKPTPSFRSVKYQRVGKKNAGRLLDGREWNEFPGVR